MVAEMLGGGRVPGLRVELAFFSCERKVFCHRYASVIEEDVVIRTQAEKVIQLCQDRCEESSEAVCERPPRTDRPGTLGSYRTSGSGNRRSA
jgi:hypothetical protein